MARQCPDPDCDRTLKYSRPQASIGQYYCPEHGAPGSAGWTGHPNYG